MNLSLYEKILLKVETPNYIYYCHGNILKIEAIPANDFSEINDFDSYVFRKFLIL